MRGLCDAALVFVLGFLGSFEAAASPDTRTVELYHGLVTIAIPAGWQEMEADSLELYTLAMAEATGGRSAEIYQHGFQPAGQPLFAYPHILVQIKESGRVPYRSCLQLPSVSEANKALGARVSERVGPAATSLTLDQLYFDPGRNALRLSTTVTNTSAGPVGVHSVSFLTQRGLFILHCFEVGARFSSTSHLFARIIDSVEISPRVAYKLGPAERWPWLERVGWPLWTLAGLIVTLTAALIVVLGRQRSGP